MKQSQWTVAVIVLAAVVFAITFAWNYVGYSGKSRSRGQMADRGEMGDEGASPGELNFGQTIFPRLDKPELDQELRGNGYHDFWFINKEDKPVIIGLDWKKCTCSQAQAYILPPQWRPQRSPALIAMTGLATGLTSLNFRLSEPQLAELEPDLEDLQRQTQPISLTEKDKGTAVVPAQAMGWVRLGWRGERQDQSAGTVLGARLWQGGPNGPKAEMGVRVRFHEPLRIKQTDLTQAFGWFDPPKEVVVRCWSSTRRSLDIQTQVVGGNTEPAGDPLAVGAPVALSPQECRELESKLEHPADQGQVLCAYRIPITVRERGADGKTWLDVGPLKRQVLIGLAGAEGWGQHVVSLRGLVRAGDVLVGDGDRDWTVSFKKPFDRSSECVQTKNVWSSLPGLKLEVDKARTARFLEASLPLEPTLSADGRQQWQLKVRVPPNRASGRFPREDDPEYRDSAIYLRTVGAHPRSIRIPVEGQAYQK